MPAETILARESLSVADYRCHAVPDDEPYLEHHDRFTLAYVRRGSFGYHTRGRRFEMVPGSLLIGHPGDDFSCSHDHHAGGDECLSIHLGPQLEEVIGTRAEVWRVGAVPPLAELMVVGELAQCAAENRTDVGLDELALVLAKRLVDVVSRRGDTALRAMPRDQRRAADAARWIEAHSHEDLDLERIAGELGLSAFHFLRLFSRTLGVTPHQYLVRSRLRHAARLLCEGERQISDIALAVGFGDLSNFVRSFRRAAGMTPSAFRAAARRPSASSRRRPGPSANERRRVGSRMTSSGPRRAIS